MAAQEHEFDLQIPCANKCGEMLHIKPKQKVSGQADGRVPRGYVCSNCKDKIQNVPQIRKPGES